MQRIQVTNKRAGKIQVIINKTRNKPNIQNHPNRRNSQRFPKIRGLKVNRRIVIEYIIYYL